MKSLTPILVGATLSATSGFFGFQWRANLDHSNSDHCLKDPLDLYYRGSSDHSKLDQVYLDAMNFLKRDIAEIYQTHRFPKSKGARQWKMIGSGVSKFTLTHPLLEGWVIKLPLFEGGFRSQSSAEDLHLDYQHLQALTPVADFPKYSQIELPSAHLFETSYAPVLLQNRFDFTSQEEGVRIMSKSSINSLIS